MTTILDQAASIVDADREKTYGNPDKNLRAIAIELTGCEAVRVE